MLATTVIDANTLSGTIGSSSLTTPGAVQLQVQNTQTLQESAAVPVTIAANSAPAASLAVSTPTTLPNGAVNTPYTFNLTASGGVSPYTWSVTSGQLPQGLNLDPATGIISGTPGSSGNYSVSLTATDSSSPAQSATVYTVAFAIVGATVAPSSPLVISTSGLPQGEVSEAYTVSLTAAGGTPPYTWSVPTGQLPPGLTLASSTGILSGTPASGGSYSLSLTATDSSSPAQTATLNEVPLAITIASAALKPSSSLEISTTTLPQGAVNAGYAASLTASGGTSPYLWSITSGQLPPGLSLSANSGTISGTPNSSGTYQIGITASDLSTPAQSATATLSIGVAAPPVSPTPPPPTSPSPPPPVSPTPPPPASPSPLSVSSSNVPPAIIGSAYSAYLQANGGTAPYTWSITSGNLPSGVNLDSSNGLISGSPNATGTAAFTATVSDSESPAQSKSVSLSLGVSPSALSITSSSTLPSGQATSGYSTMLQATGGKTPYSWSITAGSLPSGLNLAPGSGLISGTPNGSGSCSFTALVSDASNPAQTRSQSFSFTVAPSSLAITSSSTLPLGKIDSSYSTGLQAAGGKTPYTWSIAAGSLPAGLTLASNTGIISGTPTSSGSFSVGITASDSSSPAQTSTLPVDLNVQGSTNTLTNLQSDYWNSSGQVSPSYADCDTSCPGVTFSYSYNFPSPSISGRATQWNLGGTNSYSDVLWVDHLIGSASTHGLPDSQRTLIASVHNFSYDLYFYPTDPAHTQAMEFDINWSLNSVGITWSTECRMEGGYEWDIWDNVNKHWLPTGFACNPIPNGWNHVTVTGQRGANNTVIYQTITLNGVTNNINRTFAPYVVPSDWYGVTVNYQMDGDKNQTTIQSYSDNMSFTYW